MENKTKNYCTYWVKNRINAPEWIGRSYVEKIEENNYPLQGNSRFLQHLKPWLEERGLEYNIDDYMVEILQVFGSDKDAVMKHEEYLCRLHDAVDSDLFFNEDYGDKRSPKTIAKIRDGNTGKKRSDETKTKIGASMIGNTRAKGNTHTDEAKDKMRAKKIGNTITKGRKWVYNPNTGISKMIYPKQIQEYLANGHILGRPKFI